MIGPRFAGGLFAFGMIPYVQLPEPSSLTLTQVLLTLGGSLIAGGLALAGQLFREKRQRQWAREDRREAQDALDRQSQDLRHTVRSETAAVRIASEVRSAEVLTRIAENTEVSKVAFATANDVNAKIASIGLALRDGTTLSEPPKG